MMCAAHDHHLATANPDHVHIYHISYIHQIGINNLVKIYPRGQTPVLVAINRGVLQNSYKIDGCKQTCFFSPYKVAGLFASTSCLHHPVIL